MKINEVMENNFNYWHHFGSWCPLKMHCRRP